MIDNSTPKRSLLKFYEVDTGYLPVHSGASVIPDTELGRDCKTRELVKAGCFGRVLSVSFNPISNSFLIAIDKNDYLG